VDAFMCYRQKCKVVSLNLAHPVHMHNPVYTQESKAIANGSHMRGPSFDQSDLYTGLTNNN